MNHFLKKTLFCLLGLGLFALLAFKADAAKHPNFLWILSEDNSMHYLRLYGNPLGPTPHIEELAEQGIVFDHAFSCGPVCSVARTTLMTGIYAPRGGFQYHRKAQMANLPAGLQMWPAYLREAGYYTSNNSKKDYNVVEGKGVWDESSNRASWRKRPSKDTPFFHMESTPVSHESSLHFSAKQMAEGQLTTPADQVKLFPYQPDTPTFRFTVARYHDRMRAIDEVVAKLVEQLKQDGLLEDTFIFYYGDHGGVLPRSKGYVYESGLHVPLVVRIPDNWKRLVTLKPGTRAGGFVSFIDFGPTLLHLAGINAPTQLDGKPFLGPDISAEDLNARNETFGYADRFDEKYDLARSVRKDRFKYIRNYQAFYPDGLQNNYRYKMLAYAEWRQLFRDGKLNPVQSQVFQRRPAEMLFDVEADPHEVNNLANDPKQAATLTAMRERLAQHVKESHDLSFYPESYMADQALADPIAFGNAHAKEISRLVDIADLGLMPFERARIPLEEALNSSNDWERYWALIACSVFGESAQPLAGAAQKRLKDENQLVRLRAAEFLGILGKLDPRPTLYEILNQTESPLEALITLNTAVYFNDAKPALKFDLTQVQLKVKMGEVDRRLAYLRGEE